MKDEKKINRRRALQLGLGATAGLLTTGLGCNNNKSAATAAAPESTAAACAVTPEQDLGPFYPITQGIDEDLDLTMVKGRTERAAGEVILVRGRVLDDQCRPIQNALVEIWSANTHGRYHHERDQNTKPLDPNFQGWGEVTTNAAGEYGFKTIKPGAYAFGNPEDLKQWRTPHIHYKVSRRGYHEIITQLYFPNEKLNETDGVMAELSAEDRAKVIVAPTVDASGTPVFTFDVTLKQVRSAEQRAAALAVFAGTYELPEAAQGVKTRTIRHDGEQLYLDLPDYAAVELKPLGEDEFLVQPIYRRLVFNRNAEGKVENLIAHDTAKHEPSAPKTWKKIA
jgi:protocatechuate 3,4-dioxygenase, beta subunit